MRRSTAGSNPDVEAGVGWPRLVTLTAALVAFTASLAVVLTHVEVTDDAVGAARTCGSAFDSTVDRSGWELWWASDLDEPDDLIRSSLIRTTLCPAAVNRRVALATSMGGIGVIFAVLARRFRTDGRRHLSATTLGAQVARLGRATALLGGALSVAGVIALVVLVADADSTLFLYTDRLVVGVVGLIVLVPTMALFAIGRVLALVGPYLDRHDEEPRDA